MKLNKIDIIQVARYLIGYCFLYPYLLGLIVNQPWMNVTSGNILVGLVYIVYFLVTVILSFNLYKEAFNTLKQHPFKLFLEVLPIWLGMLVFVSLSSIFISMLTGAMTPVNQEEVTKGILAMPYMYIPLAIIFAPVVEEGVFRGILYGKSKNRLIGILLSCGIFGLLHCIDGLLAGNSVEVLYVLVYGAQAYFLILGYEKTGNIAGSMMIHFLNNLMGCIIVFL